MGPERLSASSKQDKRWHNPLRDMSQRDCAHFHPFWGIWHQFSPKMEGLSPYRSNFKFVRTIWAPKEQKLSRELHKGHSPEWLKDLSPVRAHANLKVPGLSLFEPAGFMPNLTKSNWSFSHVLKDPLGINSLPFWLRLVGLKPLTNLNQEISPLRVYSLIIANTLKG